MAVLGDSALTSVYFISLLSRGTRLVTNEKKTFPECSAEHLLLSTHTNPLGKLKIHL